MVKPPNLYSFPTVADIAAPLRTYILRQQKAALERHGVFRVAVSGGSLPKVLAQALLDGTNSSSPSETVRFDKWQIFFADERCVPLTDEDSNYRLLKDELLDKIPSDTLGAPQVFPIDDAQLDDEQETADMYEKTLISVFAARDSVKLPIFDLILLGCGPDGHTCSLFPGHPLLRETAAWCLSIADSPKPPPKRITLSLPVVLHAVKIAFVATGAGKKEVLRQILESEDGRSLPCGLVNDGAGDKVSWFTDHAAVDGVQYPRRSSL